MRNKKVQLVLIHVLIWIQFIVLPFVFFPKPIDIYRQGEIGPLIQDTVLTNLFFILIFYGNYFFAIPRFYYKHQYYSYGVILFLATSISLLLAYYLKLQIPVHNYLDRQTEPAIFGGIIIRLLLVLIASFGIRMYEKWRTTDIEKANIELSYLKAQINPHFLFNSLNSLYVLALKKSEETPKAIVKLSSIMRYVISDANEEYVSLEKEVNYVQDYIDLQRLRLNEQVQLSNSFEGDFSTKKIVPMLFISFIENAFKYGVSTEHPSLISIQMKLFRDELTVLITNTLHDKIVSTMPETGIGIDNSIKRIKTHYPQAQIEIGKDLTQQIFTVSLKLNLKG